ncbi:IgG receptor FcRn large subunit p51-like [Narcine bancroftii]|uniref:IgG receptor FcRn large subunit p51-like n=1 Tax=Narcine bancroftii TaxID=1343680 RepID=UPI0038310C8F
MKMRKAEILPPVSQLVQFAVMFMPARRGSLQRDTKLYGFSFVLSMAPTPLKIYSKTVDGNPLTRHVLVCETAAFYPENLTLIWYRNGTKITAGTHTRKAKNAEGLYVVSSDLTYSNGEDQYACKVYHLSLQTPAVARYSVAKQDSRNTLANYLVPSGVVVGLLILVLMIVVGVRLGRQELEGEEECGMEPNGHQDQREESNMIHYVAIHFDTSRKATKQKRLDARHAFDQKMQGEPRGTSTEYRINCKESTEYAEVKTKKDRGATEALYSTIR